MIEKSADILCTAKGFTFKQCPYSISSRAGGGSYTRTQLRTCADTMIGGAVVRWHYWWEVEEVMWPRHL